MKKIIKVVLITLILIFSIYTILQINRLSLRSYLEKSQKVDANLLIIEAWLPDLAIDLATSEIHKDSYDFIVTTGIESSELEFCMVAMNGYLIFYPEPYLKTKEENDHHNIEIVAHSEMGGKYRAHFNVFINDSLIADFNADKKAGRFGMAWNKPLGEIDSIMVQFTNDMVDDFGDANLYVKEIIIDNEIIIPYQFNSVFDIGSLGGEDRIKNDYKSHPEIIRNKLIASGIDPYKIIAVTGKKTNINRTLTGALAFRNWLKASGQKVTGVNIITMGIHARRTWITYKELLGKSYKIGIISLPDIENQTSKRSIFLETITEILDLMYYRIILLPYLNCTP